MNILEELSFSISYASNKATYLEVLESSSRVAVLVVTYHLVAGSEFVLSYFIVLCLSVSVCLVLCYVVFVLAYVCMYVCTFEMGNWLTSKGIQCFSGMRCQLMSFIIQDHSIPIDYYISWAAHKHIHRHTLSLTHTNKDSQGLIHTKTDTNSHTPTHSHTPELNNHHHKH